MVDSLKMGDRAVEVEAMNVPMVVLSKTTYKRFSSLLVVAFLDPTLIPMVVLMVGRYEIKKRRGMGLFN